jgi:two-component system LytT family response regulator
MKCVIIEDDVVQRTLLRGLLEKINNIQVHSEYSNPVEYLLVHKEIRPEIIFLDIEMPEMTGIDFLNSVNLQCPVIVTAAKKEYAFDVFNFNVVSYLLKPIHLHDLIKAIEKANTIAEETKNYLFVKSIGSLHKLLYSDILYVKGAVDYIEIFTKTKKHLVNSSLNNIETTLPSDRFVRIHRSHIVNIDYITKIENNYVIINNEELKISDTYKSALLEKIKTI